MISKIKLIKTYPNSPQLGTEYSPCNHRHSSYKDTFQNSYGDFIKLETALDNSYYYEIIYEPRFKVDDFVTDGVIKGFVKVITKSFDYNNKYLYNIEFEHLKSDGSKIKDMKILLEEELRIASDTIKLFDKIYFENDTVWKCAKNGRKPPRFITIKKYLEYIKNSNIQHFEIFQTEEQAKEWFELNEKKYSKLDILKAIKLADDKITYKSISFTHSQNYIDNQMPQEILNEL